MKLIPYAGFDPSENEFPADLLHLIFGKKKSIDVERAKELRRAGMKYPEIGRVIAQEEGRLMPYNGRSVAYALWKSRKT